MNRKFIRLVDGQPGHNPDNQQQVKKNKKGAKKKNTHLAIFLQGGDLDKIYEPNLNPQPG
jgi:hypothetical protein